MRPDRCKNPARFYSPSTQLWPAFNPIMQQRRKDTLVCSPSVFHRMCLFPDRVFCVLHKKKKDQDYLDFLFSVSIFGASFWLLLHAAT